MAQVIPVATELESDLKAGSLEVNAVPLVEWKVGLFETGEQTDCIYACACFCCAIAQSRSALDDSDCMFNVCCVPPPVTRWLVRSAYGIGQLGEEDNGIEDMWQGCILMPCVANQLYQETKARKNPTVDGGRLKNVFAPTQKPDGTSPMEIMKNAVLSCFLVGDNLKKAMGMPRLMGVICVPLFTGRQLVRYQYRIGLIDDDVIAECCVPCFMYYCCSTCAIWCTIGCSAGSAGACLPICLTCSLPLVNYNGQAAMALEREFLAHPGGKPSYLVGYSPPSK